jgi:hypothetical protein
VLSQSLEAFGAKNTANFDVLGASQAKNHGVGVGVGLGVVVVVAAAAVVVVSPAVYFLNLVVAENRQIPGIFAFF